MTIGPEPMMRIVWISVRRGMVWIRFLDFRESQNEIRLSLRTARVNSIIAPSQARHLHVHERRRVAHGHVRSQAQAQRNGRQEPHGPPGGAISSLVLGFQTGRSMRRAGE